MSVDAVAAAAREMLMLTLLAATPFLAAAMLTGFVVGVLQASTRINDMTLSFVPRLAAAALVLYLAGHWLLADLAAYMERAILAARGLGG